MKILAVSDKECAALWDNYTPGKLREYDLILSSGDLKAEYLRFLVTMARCPLMYVHGNHDTVYDHDPPEGCDCIEDRLVIYRGLRILGLGGSRSYSNGRHQYTQRQMQKRIQKLKQALKLAGGVDIVLAHAAPLGVGDADDAPHKGFEAFLSLIDEYKPRFLLHGHVHLNYGFNIARVQEYGSAKVINCWEKFVLDCPATSEHTPFQTMPRFVLKLIAPNLIIMDQ